MAETSIKVLMELDTKKMDSAVDREKKKLDELRQKENRTDTTNMRYEQKKEKAQGDIDRKVQQIKDAEEAVKRAEEALDTYLEENGELLQQIERYHELDFKLENLPEGEKLPINEWQEYNQLGDLLRMTEGESTYEKGLVELNEKIEEAKDNAIKLKNELKDLQGKKDIIQVEQDTYNENKKNKQEIKEQEKLINDMEKEEKNTVKYKEQSNNILGFMSKGMKNLLKSAISFGLAMFGIRGIFSFISSSMSTISQYDEQIGADIQYIRFALAMSIKPVIEWIVKAAYEILNTVGQIIHALTGYNIFKNSGIVEYNKGLKEAKKTLMGFDEANVIGDKGNSATPSFDLSALGGTPLEEKMNKIEVFFGKIKGKITDLLTWVRGINAGGGNIFQALGLDTSGFEGTFHGMSLVVEGFLQTIEGKFHKFISGPWKVIKGVFTGDWGLVWKGCQEIFIGFIEDITGQLLMIGGFVLTVLFMIYDNVVRTVKDIWGFITWFWGEVGKSIEKFWKEKILPFLNKIGEKIYEKIRPFIIMVGEVVLKIIEIKNELGKLWEKFKQNPFQTLWDTYNQYLKPIIDKLNDLFRHKNETFNWKFNLQEVGQKTGNFLGSVWNKITGHDSGGIVLAQPGHGVAIGSSDIMSERRSEAIIPFENPTAMEKIGEAIGKWVNIAIQNDMVVDGRVLASATNNRVNKERFLMNR